MQAHTTITTHDIQVICPQCGKQFQTTPGRFNPSTKVMFCSRPCLYLNKGMKRRVSTPRTLPAIDRFMAKTVKSGDCWLWVALINNKGYGQFCFEGKQRRAHRVSYLLFNGPIPKGMNVLHNCDRTYPLGDLTYRRCVNPDHLFLGTDADNVADMYVKQRDRHLAGFEHPMAKLTYDQVGQIRSLWETGKFRYAALGRMFGISGSYTAALIKKRYRTHN